MKIKNITYLIFAFLLISFQAFAKRENSSKAYHLLLKANKVLGQTSFIADRYVEGQWSFKYARLKKQDGVYLRKEGFKPYRNVSIINKKGMWYLINKKAILMAFYPKKTLKHYQKISYEIDENGEYFLEEGKLDNLECFIVTCKISKAQIEKSLSVLSDKFNDIDKQRFIDKTPVSRKYYIGKKDLFIYSFQGYNNKKKKVQEITYRNVKLNIKIDENLFKIPPHLEVKIVKTMSEYINLFRPPSASRKAILKRIKEMKNKRYPKTHSERIKAYFDNLKKQSDK